MSNFIKIIFIIAILIFEFFLFQFSIQIGAVSLVLIFATFSIGFVINKITTIVEQPSLVNSSEPFRDSPKYADNKTKSDIEKNSDSNNLIPGVDSSIFEHNATTIPNWWCALWKINSLFNNVSSKKDPDSFVKIKLDRYIWIGWVTE